MTGLMAPTLRAKVTAGAVLVAGVRRITWLAEFRPAFMRDISLCLPAW